jgi:hypothetical protein
MGAELSVLGTRPAIGAVTNSEALEVLRSDERIKDKKSSQLMGQGHRVRTEELFTS